MTEQHTLEVGNAIMVLTDMHDSFRDGHTTGYLECDNERHRPCFPLTSHSICKHLLAVVSEPSLPSLRKAGRIAGWMEALMEPSPQTFKSLGCSRTDNRFASHGKEKIRERRERALASPVPLMRVNDLSLVKQKCLIDEREE